jgi:glycosyltransferase involved in cell wall biosynthesis
MPLYMSASDTLLLTSSHEGSPTVVREALANGLPVVSTDVGDVRERIQGVPGCAVVPSADPQALADALRTVLSQQGGERQASPQALGLDEHRLTQQVIDLYQALLERTVERQAAGRNSKNILKNP